MRISEWRSRRTPRVGFSDRPVRVADFEYELPETSRAQEAIEPRHAARLLDTRDMTDHVFLDLPELLQPGDLVVVNDTRVRAARVTGRRTGTGGKVEMLFLESGIGGSWEVLARPARRLRPGAEVEFEGAVATVIESYGEGLFTVSLDATDPEAFFDAAGTVPLPPYFHGRLDDPERYQTSFAHRPGSVAAPTAGLHFTDEVVEALDGRGILVATIDLHVSLDTFRPMTVDLVEDHRMHSEWCEVPVATAEAVERTRAGRGSVVAIGTTVVRSLESRATGGGRVEPGAGPTDLFLRPGSEISVVDILVTNFHLPGSTLLVLLEAFMGPDWRQVYTEALARGYRFLSFGDAMVCERAG
jgi:S-adenosylmethionine:tRNA ribosyltransferase-isomerase